MLAGFCAVVISLLCSQVRCDMPVGSDNVSNTASSNGIGIHSILQNVNQLPQNQGNTLQKSLSLQQFKGFNNQQGLNLQQPTNLQVLNTKQPMNLVQPSLNSQQTGTLQNPVNLQVANTLQQNLPQNMNLPQQNPVSKNIQILRQISDASALPVANAQFTQNFQEYSPNPSIINNKLNLPGNSLSETAPVLYPQNQQMLYGGVPSYVIDGSQAINAVPRQVFSANVGELNNQPTLLTVLAVPQQNQPSNTVSNPLVQNSSEQPNQITIIKSIQPQPASASIGHDIQNQIGLPGMSPSPGSYANNIPSISSLLASTLSKEASKSSSLKALLPLIFNLIKERNTCSCSHPCRCPNNSRRHMEEYGDAYEDCPKHKMYRFNEVENAKYGSDKSAEYDDNKYESRRHHTRYGRHKKVQPESSEYDYSDEFQDD